jgi:hypothetical protein
LSLQKYHNKLFFGLKLLLGFKSLAMISVALAFLCAGNSRVKLRQVIALAALDFGVEWQCHAPSIERPAPKYSCCPNY